VAANGTSSDAHSKILGIAEELLKRRAEVQSKNGAYPFFWDFMQPEAKTLDDVFKEELSRTPTYEKLQETVSKEHKFSAWLPDKVRLSFLSSFERDTRLLYKSRAEAFVQAGLGCTYRAGQIKGTVDGIKAVTENQSGGKS
jgi:hypothetical protein